MPSIPSSPRTPTKRRGSSVDVEITSASLQDQVNGPRRPSVNRSASQYSTESPITPRLATSQEWQRANSISHQGDADDPSGLGNLADELAEALDEDEEIEQEGSSKMHLSQIDDHQNGYSRRNYHSELGISTSPPRSIAESNRSLSPPKQAARMKHRRLDSQYEGSDYGEDSDFETTDGLSASFESRLAVVESLARRGIEANGSDLDTLVKRFAYFLKELPAQSRVENGITRLITAYSSLSSHLANQSRLVLSLSHPLTSPLSIPPDPDTIDELLLLIADLILGLPSPALHCLSSLHSFYTSTRDLQSTLTQLTDTIYMARQTSTQASRKLKTASDMVSEMRKEADAREEGVKWIEKGGWDAKLKGRECARMCREVVGGFEEVCDGWRDRLTAGGGVEVGAA